MSEGLSENLPPHIFCPLEEFVMAQSHTSNDKALNVMLIVLRLMMFLGLCALAYVLLQSCSSPKADLLRFAKGELKRLEVIAPSPPQPSLKFEGPEGKDFNLKEFRGDYVLLNVWATWCAPCVAEMPSLNQLQADMKARGLKVVAVSMDRARVDAMSFYKTYKITDLDLYSDTSMSMGTKLNAKGLPISIFYDSAGRELARISGEVDWQSKDVEVFLKAILPTQ